MSGIPRKGRRETVCASNRNYLHLGKDFKVKYQKMTMISTEKCEVKEEVITLQQKWESAHLSGDRVSDG